MSLLIKVIILAILQGLTEFLPVSSSGHLVLFQDLFNIKENPVILDLFLHAGTLLAVFFFFFNDLKELTLNFYKKDNLRYISYIILGSIPTAIIGFVFKEDFESMFSKSDFIVSTFLITASLLIMSRFIRIKKVNIYLAVIIIGIFQGLAIVPGLSRSGLTISIALILSLGFEFSFKFSFLLSIPAIIGAIGLEILTKDLALINLPVYLIGLTIAFIIGLFALKILKRILLKERFYMFSYYLIGISILILLLR